MKYPTEHFEIDGHKFTVAKNITGTGGYVLCSQTPEPKFISTCNDLETGKRYAQEYLDGLA